MEMKWTKQQQEAISSEGAVIVSAGAGSGKTTVLVERIMRLVKTNDIDKYSPQYELADRITNAILYK